MTEPLCYASGYSLDLYCDRVNEDHPWNSFPHTFTGETFGECAKQARRRGWIFHKSIRTATCPQCSGKGRAIPDQHALALWEAKERENDAINDALAGFDNYALGYYVSETR